MPNMLSSGQLYNNISTDLADNNAGLISAEDVRHNMEDIVVSINRIVASGDTDGEFRFYNNVRVAATGIGAGGGEGKLVMESGIIFPNAPDGKTTLVQVVPYPGEGGIIHDNLIIDQTSHPHTQYYHKTGVNQADNVLTGNVPVGHANWINASGYSDVGFKFVPVQDTLQEIYTSGTLRFGDGSSIPNGKGLAKAWCNFNASGDATDNLPSIRSYYNISGITRLAPGKLKITFNSGVFDNNNYTALATSHGTVATGSKEDMIVNTVGLVLRQGNDGADDADNPRTVTYVIRTETGDYADAEICDFVAFGTEPNETLGDVPFKLMDPSYSENA